MKKLLIRLAFLCIIISTLISCVGCLNHISGPMVYLPPIEYEVSSNKSVYNYGEEITIELLFSADDQSKTWMKDRTYSVKIAESPYYEIIGDSEVEAYPSQNKYSSQKKYNGKYIPFWYRVVFKIKVTEDSDGMQPVKLYINCINDDWLKEEMDTGSHSSYESDHPDYPFGICCSSIFYFGFGTDSKGVQFDDFGCN